MELLNKEKKISNLQLSKIALDINRLHDAGESKSKLPPLETVLAYKNEHVVDGIILAFDIEKNEAEMLFTECIRWLWYCSVPTTANHRNIDEPLLILDEIWHMFMLYTPYYTMFCQTYFGHYIHHMPTLIENRIEFKKLSIEEVKIKKKQQYELIFDVLGKDVFILWYHRFPENFSKSKILKLRKK